GRRAFSCQTQMSEVAGRAVTTIEGLSADSSHPVQKAWLAENVPQCGYCQSGQIMSAAALLKETPKPSRDQIVEHMNANICRCGTYQRIVRAVERAAREGGAMKQHIRLEAPLSRRQVMTGAMGLSFAFAFEGPLARAATLANERARTALSPWV